MAADAILVPAVGRGSKIAGLGASASSAEQLLGPNRTFIIVGSDAFHLRLGRTGMGAADATDFRIPANTAVTLDSGPEFTHFRVFNSTVAAIDIYYWPASRTS